MTQAPRPHALHVLTALVVALTIGLATAEADRPVPELPFPNNPDPDACGIPRAWGPNDAAWLDGAYEGELVEPVVHLYDSHLRSAVTGALPTGTSVRVILYQNNPVLDFYLVRGEDPDGTTHEGWVPAPFLAFEEP